MPNFCLPQLAPWEGAEAFSIYYLHRNSDKSDSCMHDAEKDARRWSADLLFDSFCLLGPSRVERPVVFPRLALSRCFQPRYVVSPRSKALESGTANLRTVALNHAVISVQEL